MEELAYFTAHPMRQTCTDFPSGMVPVAILRPGPVIPNTEIMHLPSSSVTLRGRLLSAAVGTQTRRKRFVSAHGCRGLGP